MCMFTTTMKILKKLLIIFCLVPLAFFSSCEKADQVGDEIDLIEIMFQQRVVDNKIEPYLLCTGGEFECRNVSIDFDYYKTKNALYVNFGKSSGPDCSGTEWNPAHVYIYLGYLEKGNYIFDITNKDRVLHANLKVEDGKYTVTSSIGETVTFNADPLVYQF